MSTIGYDAKATFTEREKLTPENFCYWLQGYIEIQRATGQPIVITDREVRVIEEHLNLIFNKKVTVPVDSLGGVFDSTKPGCSLDIGKVVFKSPPEGIKYQSFNNAPPQSVERSIETDFLKWYDHPQSC